jgi:hypothetical protein
VKLVFLAVIATLGIPASPAAADPARFVLVPRATLLYSAPRNDASSWTDPDLGDVTLREDDFWVLRKIRDLSDGWVEVATARSPGSFTFPASAAVVTLPLKFAP